MLAILLFCSVGLTLAKTNLNYFNSPEVQWTRPETPEVGFLGLSSGASLVVPNIQTHFSCLGRAYGYYADVDNNCQIYHICQPSTTAKGEAVIYHYTNFCPNQTRFDQRLLSCQSLSLPNLLPCEQSVQYYQLTEARFGGQLEGQQREVAVEQTPEVQTLEQTVEQQQTQVEEVTPVPASVKGLQPIQTPVTVNRSFPTKNIVRSESVEVVQQPNIPVAQPVLPQSGLSFQSVAPIRSVQTVQTVPQAVPSQPVVPQTNVVQPITSLRNVEPVVPNVSEDIVSQPVAPVVPTPVFTQPGLVGPATSLRSSRFTQTTSNQPVVTIGRSSVFQPLLSQPSTFFRSVPQPSIPVNQVPTSVVPQTTLPFRSTQTVENFSNQGVVSQPLLSRYNVPSQFISVQSPQVAPQVYRTQSTVSHYSVPQVSVTPVVTQSIVPQPVVSQYTVPFGSQRLISQSFFSAIPNLLRFNGPFVNVVRPAQNPEFIN